MVVPPDVRRARIIRRSPAYIAAAERARQTIRFEYELHRRRMKHYDEEIAKLKQILLLKNEIVSRNE